MERTLKTNAGEHRPGKTPGLVKHCFIHTFIRMRDYIQLLVGLETLHFEVDASCLVKLEIFSGATDA